MKVKITVNHLKGTGYHVRITFPGNVHYVVNYDHKPNKREVICDYNNPLFRKFFLLVR